MPTEPTAHHDRNVSEPDVDRSSGASPRAASREGRERPALVEAWIAVHEWIGRHETALIFAVLVAVGGVWAFAELSDEVLEGSTQAFDERVLLAMRHADDLADPVGPDWLEEVGRDLTALGGVAVLLLLSLSVAIYLALRRKTRALLLVVASVGGGTVLSLVLKELFDRPRPDLVPQLSHVATASFPSGHSMLSAVVYLTLGALLARVHTRRSLKAFFLLLALTLTLLVGVSRVYLGVHWPTDVLGGWTLGAAWAALCSLVAGWLHRRGEVEDLDVDVDDAKDPAH